MYPAKLKQLIHRCNNHDSEAFTELVEFYQSYVYKLAYRILYNQADASDAVQDTFMKVWVNIGQYRAKYKFTTWLYQIVNNICIDKIRKHQLKQNYEHCLVYSGMSEDQRYDELHSIARSVLDKLPPQQRVCFALRDLEEFEMPEIAEITGLKVNQVKSNLYYARKKMREILTTVYKYQP